MRLCTVLLVHSICMTVVLSKQQPSGKSLQVEDRSARRAQVQTCEKKDSKLGKESDESEVRDDERTAVWRATASKPRQQSHSLISRSVHQRTHFNSKPKPQSAVELDDSDLDESFEKPKVHRTHAKNPSAVRILRKIHRIRGRRRGRARKEDSNRKDDYSPSSSATLHVRSEDKKKYPVEEKTDDVKRGGTIDEQSRSKKVIAKSKGGDIIKPYNNKNSDGTDNVPKTKTTPENLLSEAKKTGVVKMYNAVEAKPPQPAKSGTAEDSKKSGRDDSKSQQQTDDNSDAKESFEIFLKRRVDSKEDGAFTAAAIASVPNDDKKLTVDKSFLKRYPINERLDIATAEARNHLDPLNEIVRSYINNLTKNSESGEEGGELRATVRVTKKKHDDDAGDETKKQLSDKQDQEEQTKHDGRPLSKRSNKIKGLEERMRAYRVPEFVKEYSEKIKPKAESAAKGLLSLNGASTSTPTRRNPLTLSINKGRDGKTPSSRRISSEAEDLKNTAFESAATAGRTLKQPNETEQPTPSRVRNPFGVRMYQSSRNCDATRRSQK